MDNNNREGFWDEFDRIAQTSVTWLWRHVMLPVIEVMAIATVVGTVALVVMFALSLYGLVRVDAAAQTISWVGGAR